MARAHLTLNVGLQSMTRALPDVKALKRRMAWGVWLALLGVLMMASSDELIAVSGLPVAVVGSMGGWAVVKYRHRIQGSVSEPERTTTRKKAGIQAVIASVIIAGLFLVRSPRIPRAHLTTYFVCVSGAVCVSAAIGLALWRPWK